MNNIHIRANGYLKWLLLSLALCLTVTTGTYAKEKERETTGVYEMITVFPQKIRMKAKFDTGAANSSLDARNIHYFQKDGKEWVRFDFIRAADKKPHTLEYPIIRKSRIVSRTTHEKNKNQTHHERPAIRMDICIGDQHKNVEVNLIDRSNFKFPFLLGASALAEFSYVVDVQSTYLLPTHCTAPETK